MNTPPMEAEDESAALAAELRIRTAERDAAMDAGKIFAESAAAMTLQRDELVAERNALTRRLARQPAMREVIRELVAVLVEIQDRQNDIAEMRLKELIRRMDRERE